MSGALDPIQEELPFDFGPAPTVPSAQPPAPSGWRQPGPAAVDLAPSLYETAWRGLRSLPWRQWRASATPLLRSGVGRVGTVARVAVTRGTPYTVQLARATAQISLVRAFPLLIARTIHLVGFPAVVLRTAIQCTTAHRLGLLIDEVVFFRIDDPAGYTVYEAPARLGSALMVAYLPALILGVLSVICLAPALEARVALHLPATWITGVQLWLGMAFAAHALPSYEEAGPVAEQARVGVGQADPVSVFWVIPAQAVAILSRFGGIIPAVVGVVIAWWLAGAIFR
jgi:hypothetical protein